MNSAARRLGAEVMQVKQVFLGAVAVVAVGAAAACGGGSGGGGGAEGASVSRESFEEEDLQWPFSIEEGTLSCEDGAVSFETPTGEVYGVNGEAIDSGDYAAPDPIWLNSTGEDSDDASLSGKVPLNDMIERGEQEC